jgi:diadenosine tetraphosphate (Ap4A) HIT family hydrolase
MKACPFCSYDSHRLFNHDENCLVMIDLYPVTLFHSLVVPRRHVASYFDLYPEEIASMNTLLASAKKRIEEADPSVVGFNIGVNDGEAAGQSIFHCHMHLIPRRRGDVEDPRGGVRGVIPYRRLYREER